MDGIYQIPDRVYRETEQHSKDVRAFLENNLSKDLFKSRRVPRGIYAQRQDGLYMARVRVAGATLATHQLRQLAELSAEFGNGKLHVTTRQDMQLHDLYIEDTPEVMEQLLEVGLTPAGGGGNTIRNVMACSHGGLAADEVFDPRPYAVAVTDYFLRFDDAYHMPRKLKIAFSGCPADCVFTGVHDIGFLARRRNGVRGFRVFIGGGLGADSRSADVFRDFVRDTEVLRIVEAVKRLFDRYGDRRNRHRARLRYTVERLGPGEFCRQLEREWTKTRRGGIPDLELPAFQTNVPTRGAEIADEERADDEFHRWKKRAVKSQKQDGYSYVKVLLARGDISAEDALVLAALADNHGNGEIRIEQHQNVLLPWIPTVDLPEIYRGISGSSGELTGSQATPWIAACKGAATCRLGLCRSQDLVEAISREVQRTDLDPEVFASMNLRISGCPNNCGKHSLADPGFFGGARRQNGQSYPVYHLVAGAESRANGTNLSDKFVSLPARRIPKFLVAILQDFHRTSNGETDFAVYWQQRGKRYAFDIAEDYQHVPAYSEDPAFYRDWGILEDFTLAGRSDGECGAGVIELVANELKRAERYWRKANKARAGSEEETDLLAKAVITGAGSLLLITGREPNDPEEVLKAFGRSFINTGIAETKYRNLLDGILQMLHGENGTAGLESGCVREFLDHIQEIFDRMDASLNFRD